MSLESDLRSATIRASVKELRGDWVLVQTSSRDYPVGGRNWRTGGRNPRSVHRLSDVSRHQADACEGRCHTLGVRRVSSYAQDYGAFAAALVNVLCGCLPGSAQTCICRLMGLEVSMSTT